MENKKTVKIYMFSAAGILLLSLALRILNFFMFYDSNIGYYSFGAVLPVISNWILGISILSLLVFALIKFRNKEFGQCESTPKVQYISAAIASLLAVALAVSDLSKAITTGSRIFVLSFTLSIMTALYFAVMTSDLSNRLKALTGIFAIVRITILILTCFTDFSVAVNTPDRAIYALAAASALLFVASELKLVAGNIRSWLYIFSAASTVILGAVASIPSIIAYHAGLLPAENSFGMEYYFMLGITVYTATRLISLVRRINDTKSEEAEPTENDQ